MGATGGGDESDDDGGWRYSLSDLDDEEADQTADPEETESRGEGVAGTLEPSETIEPGDIDPENAAFVVLGVLVAVAATASYVFLVF